MNDRELLEMAARAAGIEQASYDGVECGWYVDGRIYAWNPLTSDGDALRLAVMCGISIGPESPDVIGRSLCRASWLNKSHSLGEYGNGDPLAATRRAIVRAAAAIGEGME